MNNKKRLFEVMSYVDSTFKSTLNENKDIEEGKYSQMRNSMQGLRSSINSMGIITAENPMRSTNMSSEENIARNKQLMTDIRTMGYGYRQADKGMYFGVEYPLLINNISKDELIQLGNKYNQESIIWGSKQEENGKVNFKWEMIYGSDTRETVYTVVSGEEVDSRDNLYTVVQGRKFVLPFFSDKKYQSPSNDFKKEI